MFFSAYGDFQRAFAAGSDGRPDWLARKSCNYITAAVEVNQRMILELRT